MKRLGMVCAVTGMLAVLSVPGFTQGELNEHLMVFEPYIGKIWKGTFSGVGDDGMKFDVSSWERALNGNAIRILHSVDDGVYGGESIVFWDAAKGKVAYYYFTTAGFYTNGTMQFEEGRIVASETVTGNQNGITEVKSINQLLPDGKLHTKSQYLQNGEWVDGHEIYYVEDKTSKVIFK